MAIPIARKPSGYFYGNRAAAVQVEVFIDIQCPHSRRAWPAVMQLRKHYLAEQIGLAVHMITLSNHRQSWDISKAIVAVAQDNDSVFFEFVSYLYERQSQFYNDEFLNKTHAQLFQLIAGFGEDFDGTSRATMSELLDDDAVYSDARTPIRYAATKGVWAAPTFFVNASEQHQLGSQAPVAKWRELIDPLVHRH